jgi:protein SCO1/2
MAEAIRSFLRYRPYQTKDRRAMNMRFLAALLALAGCSPAQPSAHPPLEGARIGGPFSLVDQNGRPRTERDYAGKWRVMYFGYTFCPDVCPLDMQNVGAGLRAFEKAAPARAAGVVPIFVSVDPARDSPAVLKQFVSAFHPRMVGLTGSPAQVAAAAKAYAVYSSKGAETGGGYLVNHSRQTYLIDPAGKPIALVPADQSPQAVTETLDQWVK